MAGTSITLAALATSAVPGLVVEAYRDFPEAETDFTAALLETPSGKVVARVPTSERSEVRLSAEILSLTALSEGLRSELPFELPRILGMTRAGESRAVISSFLEGDVQDIDALSPDGPATESIAKALATLHELPAAVVQEQGLPTRLAAEVRADCARLVERAQSTRVLPEAVRSHWEKTLESSELWDFQSTVIHGSMGAEQLRMRDEEVAGIAGWSDTAVGDPASDFAWLFGAPDGVFDSVLGRYRSLRSGVFGSAFIARATFWHELELAKWLIHGMSLRDADIVDDAVAMLDQLVEQLGVHPKSTRASQPRNEDEVLDMLDQTPRDVDRLSDTAAYDALDEDRVFQPDADFVEAAEHDIPARADSDEDSRAGQDDSGPSSDGDGGDDRNAHNHDRDSTESLTPDDPVQTR